MWILRNHIMPAKVEPITLDNFDDQIVCCVGTQRFENPNSWFKKGIECKRSWLKQQLEEYGEVGKIAYEDGNPVGFFEYVPGYTAPLAFPDRNQRVYASISNYTRWLRKGSNPHLERRVSPLLDGLCVP
jgi:hypothetical protein